MEKLSKELKLMLLMTDGHNYTAAELCKQIGTTRRQLYNYLKFFRENEFIVVHENSHYRLDTDSPFFQEIARSVNFSDTEATFMHHLLEAADAKNPVVGILKRKLERFYHLRFYTDTRFKAHTIDILNKLRDAINHRQTVCLKDYSSPHSRSVSDRVVEPYMFLNDNLDVRCYELKSHTNKTFKLSRIGDVETYDAPWIHTERHRQLFTDIFMFSSEQRLPICLRMGQLSHNLMIEEYPASTDAFTPDDSDHWLLNIDVASYVGIGRFVLGLYDDIEVLGGEEFKNYIQQKILTMNASAILQ